MNIDLQVIQVDYSFNGALIMITVMICVITRLRPFFFVFCSTEEIKVSLLNCRIDRCGLFPLTTAQLIHIPTATHFSTAESG